MAQGRGFWLLLAASVLGGALIALYYANVEAHYVSTDYAVVQAPVTDVSAPQAGTVVGWDLPVGARLRTGTVVVRVRAGSGAIDAVRLATTGTVTASFAAQGDSVVAGEVLGEVAALDRSVIVAEVPESEAHRLAVGQGVAIRLPDDPSTLSGRVSRIGRATLAVAAGGAMPTLVTANATQYVPVSVNFRKGGLRVVNGMSASVRVHVG